MLAKINLVRNLIIFVRKLANPCCIVRLVFDHYTGAWRNRSRDPITSNSWISRQTVLARQPAINLTQKDYRMCARCAVLYADTSLREKARTTSIFGSRFYSWSGLIAEVYAETGFCLCRMAIYRKCESTNQWRRVV